MLCGWHNHWDAVETIGNLLYGFIAVQLHSLLCNRQLACGCHAPFPATGPTPPAVPCGGPPSASPPWMQVPKYSTSPYSCPRDTRTMAARRQGFCFSMPHTMSRQPGPSMKAVTASMLMMKSSRAAYRESALAYSFPAGVQHTPRGQPAELFAAHSCKPDAVADM